jgi:hypothetical protein
MGLKVKNTSEVEQRIVDINADPIVIAVGEEGDLPGTTGLRRVYESKGLASKIDAGSLQVRDETSGHTFKKAKYFRGWLMNDMVPNLA